MGNKLKAISKISVALALLGAAVPAVEAAPTAMAAKKATKKAKKSTKKVVKKSTKKAKKAKKTTKKVAKKTAAKKPAKKAVKKPVSKKPATKAVKKPVSKKPATKVVKKTTTKKPANKAVEHVTMADKYQPKVTSGTVNVDWGTDLYYSDNGKYRAENFITNRSLLPADVKFYYLDPVNTEKSGTYKTRIEAKYKDGSKEVVGTVTFVVSKSEAERYQPKVKSSTVNVNWDTELYDPEDFITNKSSLPSDVEFYYLDDVDTRKAGTYKTRIEAQYDDGSQDVVGTVTFVVRKSDAEKYPPTVKDVTLNWDDSFDLRKDVITNAPGYFPENTKFSIINGNIFDGNDIDWEYGEPGTYNAQISVEYPDGSEDTKTFKITILPPPPSDAETYKAKVSLKSSNFTVSSNETLEHETDDGNYTLNDPTRFLNIGSALPKGTTISFDSDSDLDSVDKPAPGKHETSLYVHFPDGSEFHTDKFTVNVKTDADEAKVSLKSSNFTVSFNETLEHLSGSDVWGWGSLTLNDPTRFLNIGSALPEGTIIRFDGGSGLDSVDEPAPGKYEASLVIYFPDGSEYTTDKFTVNVITDADKAKVSLKSSNFTVSSNETLEHKNDDGNYTLNDPTRFLNIGSALPEGTIISFSNSNLDSVDKPDPGEYGTSLIIDFPDGSYCHTDNFTVNVK